MESPILHTRQFIEVRLGPAKCAKWPATRRGEHIFARSWPPLEDEQGLIREVDDVRLGILGPGVGQEPCAALEIELAPCRPPSFFTALPCQGKKFNNPTVRASDLSGSNNDLR